MKTRIVLPVILLFLLLLTACGNDQTSANTVSDTGITEIRLQDDLITVDGSPVTSETSAAVYTARDIVYYESGKDFTYGEGADADAHSLDDAAAHTVVHITQPGTYSIAGTLSQGQISVDLGSDAKGDPNAVVTLILNGVDITCEVAPAIIFYNVYECGSKDAETASEAVDTSTAGANVMIADDTVNTVRGSYVARIYQPDSVVLNKDGTAVEDAKKLHKYDGAFYSRMSMNVDGGKNNTGELHIHAENEGLDSELHLTINGGRIYIDSGNDGINTNEDGVSVTSIHGGTLSIHVNGKTGEGDGIDSNGWLVINGGTVIAEACAASADAGIDSDMGIHINGGTVLATGHMLDRIEDGSQNYAVFSFAEPQNGSHMIRLKTEDGSTRMEWKPENDFSVLIYSSPDLTAGTYTLWSDDTQLACQIGGMSGKPGAPGERPASMSEGTAPPEGAEMIPPEGFDEEMPPPGTAPFPAFDPPEPPDFSDTETPPPADRDMANRPDDLSQPRTSDFVISDGGSLFGSVSPTE